MALNNEIQDEDSRELQMPQSIPRGLLRHIIPRLLHSSEMTGTEIMQRLRELSDGLWNPSPGTIYPMLASLEEEGIIEAASTEGRSKKYRVTDEGRRQMAFLLSHQRGAVGEKTRLGPRLWEKLLEPKERLHFHMVGMEHSIECFESLSNELDNKQRMELLHFLEEITIKITEYSERLRTGARMDE
jgi:DNA-binding PadR family transcriptional regulator